MSSYPKIVVDASAIKISFREEYASEALDKRFVGSPTGVYEGFAPSFTTPIVTLAVSSRGLSLARVFSQASKTSIDIVLDSNVTLDFTGHDFGASGPLYIVAKANYVVGSPTTAQILTQNVAPTGSHEIGICRVTGSGVGTVTGVFFDSPPDRFTPIADAFNSYGYMLGGSQEILDQLNSLSGSVNVDTSVRNSTFTILPAEVGRVFLLDMGSIVANRIINLPASASVEEGATVGFFSLTGVPSGFSVTITPNGSDKVFNQSVAAASVPLRKFAGHAVFYSLVKTGVANPVWVAKSISLSNSHAGDHALGGADPLKLDDLSTPDDNTDLDATAARHGLLPKLSGVGTDVLRGDGTFGAAPGGPPALHASTHELGQTDELNVLTLGGYPSDASQVLHGDATFLPQSLFCCLGSSGNASPIAWNTSHISVNNFTLFSGSTEINVLTPGFYLVSVGCLTVSGAAGFLSLRVNGVAVDTKVFGAIAGSEDNVSLSRIIEITTPGTQLIDVVHVNVEVSGFNSLSISLLRRI